VAEVTSGNGGVVSRWAKLLGGTSDGDLSLSALEGSDEKGERENADSTSSFERGEEGLVVVGTGGVLGIEAPASLLLTHPFEAPLPLLTEVGQLGLGLATLLDDEGLQLVSLLTTGHTTRQCLGTQELCVGLHLFFKEALWRVALHTQIPTLAR